MVRAVSNYLTSVCGKNDVYISSKHPGFIELCFSVACERTNTTAIIKEALALHYLAELSISYDNHCISI